MAARGRRLTSLRAGHGVDDLAASFRGPEGFWRAYPALGRALCASRGDRQSGRVRARSGARLGFYGHRLALYRRTVPHRGFALLQEIAAGLRGGAFVFTSNVDGSFRRPALPMRGSWVTARFITCSASAAAGARCGARRASSRRWTRKPADCSASRRAPALRRRRAPQHPDVRRLGLDSRRTEAQEAGWSPGWSTRRPVVIELGAGENVLTVRRFAESIGGRLVRINPQAEPMLPAGAIHLRCGALEGIATVHAAWSGTADPTPGFALRRSYMNPRLRA